MRAKTARVRSGVHTGAGGAEFRRVPSPGRGEPFRRLFHFFKTFFGESLLVVFWNVGRLSGGGPRGSKQNFEFQEFLKLLSGLFFSYIFLFL